MAGLYLHIPFCKTKCIYCDFYSVTDCSAQKAFLSRLREELRERRDELPEGEKVRTIYFGGGTPSLLSPSELEPLLETIRDCYPLAPEPLEVTMECNPGDLSAFRARELLALGINRFSIGAQSFDPAALRFLSRRHTPAETKALVRLLRDAGADNLTLDLIYAIPGTTLETLRRDLEELVALRPDHISAYSLMYEEGTPLFRGLQERKVTEVDEDTALEMGRLVRAFLSEKGYEQYEISNFKRLDPARDLRSRHNSSYWDGTPYLGFGPSAHSYVHPVRSWNPSDLGRYLAREPREMETLTAEMVYEEYLLTRLRTSEGIDLDRIRALIGSPEAYEAFEARALDFTRGPEPLLIRQGTRLRLTSAGIDLSDALLRHLA